MQIGPGFIIQIPWRRRGISYRLFLLNTM